MPARSPLVDVHTAWPVVRMPAAVFLQGLPGALFGMIGSLNPFLQFALTRMLNKNAHNRYLSFRNASSPPAVFPYLFAVFSNRQTIFRYSYTLSRILLIYHRIIDS